MTNELPLYIQHFDHGQEVARSVLDYIKIRGNLLAIRKSKGWGNGVYMKSY